MNFKRFDLRGEIIVLCIALGFPLFKFFSSDGDRLLRLIDAATVTGLVFLIIGVFYSFILRGDLDVTEYFTRRVAQRGVKPFKAFLRDKEEEREGRFNYPLLNGIIMLILSWILTLLNY